MTNYSRAVGIERAFPSAMVATGATFASVIWAGTSGPGLPQLAARTTRCFRAARARRRQHCHAHRVLMAQGPGGAHTRTEGVSNRFLSISINRFLNELHLGKLSETVVVHGNAPHDRPRFLVNHLIGNRPSFLCTKAPMLRDHDKLSGWHQISGCLSVTCVDCEWPFVLLV